MSGYEDVQEELRRLRNKVEQQDKELERLKRERQQRGSQSRSGDDTQETGDDTFSRRTFLKALGGGAAGLGALGVMGSAAGFTVTSSHPFTVKNSAGSETLDVDTQGVLTTNQIGTGSNPVSSIHTDRLHNVRFVKDISNLQSAIDDVAELGNRNSHGGARIVLTGKYHDASTASLPITLKNGVTISGDGDAPTFIDATGVSSPVFRAENTGGEQTSLIRIENIAIDGDTTAGSKGVELDEVHFWKITACRFRNLEYGIHVKGSYIGEVSKTICRQNGADGLFAEKSSANMKQTNALRINGGGFLGNSGVGIHVKDFAGLYVDGADVENNLEYGILTDGVIGGSISAYLETNGSNLTRSYDIGLSPDPSTHSQTEGLSVTGGYINTDGVGIKLGDVNSINIGGWRFNDAGTATGGIELDTAAVDVDISVCDYGSLPNTIVPPHDGGAVPPAEINGGRWETHVFGSLGDIENAISNNALNNPENAITVVIDDDISGDAVIDGANYPGGTRFVAGRGQGAVTLTASTTGNPVINLTRIQQRAEGFEIDASNLSSQPAVRANSSDNRIEHIRVSQSGGTAFFLGSGSSRCLTFGCVVKSANVSGLEIDDNGSNNRTIGNDANVDTADATSPVTSGNADSA